MLSVKAFRSVARLFPWVCAVHLLVLPALSRAEAESETRERVQRSLEGVRVPFIANAGQADPAVAYYASTPAGTVFVTREGRVVYSLPAGRASGPGARTRHERSGWSLTEKVVGGRARPKGSEPASARVSYFVGNDPARWRSGLPTFEGVSLGEVWPGIRLELRAHGKNVEKLFTVEPGADASRIRVRVAGGRLRVNRAGALVVGTDLGELTFTAPAAYQERAGTRRPVRVAYSLRGREYGFRLDDYDPTLTVVIDPLLQATFLGGGGDDYALSVAIHPTTGDVYVAGQTNSANFPGTAGGAQTANSGGVDDVFVARLTASLTTLTQATYLGGSGDDEPSQLAIHPTTGDVYVVGFTDSTNFPGTTGGAQAAYGGGAADAFVARLTSSLTALTQATYLGGSGDDEGTRGLAIHPTTGDVYVAGLTDSTDFPGTTGGAQAANGGGVSDAFVVRLTSSLTALTQATYLGGSGNDQARGLAIHPTTGDVYVDGLTDSTSFPGTAGGAQAAYGGGGLDAFVARLTSSLTTLTQATYLGGSAGDRAIALAIHPTTGDVYVAGFTNSPNFPGTTGGAQAASGGGIFDAFVARLTSSLTALTQATYLGGSGDDENHGALAIHPTTGDVYVAGLTDSANFPGTAGGDQSDYGGGLYDAFVARLPASLTTLTQATYLGGSGDDEVYGLAIHPTTGDVYVAGLTDGMYVLAGGAQPANGGGYDGFVARLTADLGGGFFYTLTPCRVINTTKPDGPLAGPALSAGTTRTFAVAGQCGIPSSATSLSINVTITQPTAAGDLRLFPGGASPPLVSTINYRPGQTRANNAVMSVGAATDFSVRCDQASGTVQLIIDVNGYFH